MKRIKIRKDSSMKIYMIILDGVADRKIETLGNKTSLQVSNTPALDTLVKKGAQTLITVIDEKITPESDSGSMALLSYDPQIYYPGRGTLEGLGTGFIPDGYNYAAFRINFASYDEKLEILDRRTARGLEDEELQNLAKDITENVDLSKFNVNFKLLAFGHHRGVLVLYSKTEKLSGNVSNTDPGFRKIGVWGIPVKNYEPKPLKCFPLDKKEESKRTADIVNKFIEQSNKILAKNEVNRKRMEKGELPANYLIFRDGGEKPKQMPKFQEKFGLTLSMYGQLPAENAIAKLIGANFTFSKSLDLQLDKEFLINAEKILVADEADVKFIHLKGPDEPGHDNKPKEKIEAIEFIDKYFLSNLIKDIKEEDIVIVTCDHATPCELKIHATDKVPVLISGENMENDGSTKFNEENAIRGKLPIEKAIDIFPYITKEILNDKNKRN